MNALHAARLDDEASSIFEQAESGVRSYCRSIPNVFTQARNARLTDEDGNSFIDFLAGAGSLNYGHNNPLLKEKLIEYIQGDGITHSLDMHTQAKEKFLEALQHRILRPRNLNYVAQFTGPTGANAVEAAMKLARKVTGRTNIIAFTNGFHGVTMGALAATGNQHHRGGAGMPLTGITRMPYANYFGPDADTIAMMEQMIDDPSSGVDLPAAVIVEAVQGEGGLNVSSADWLQRLSAACRSRDILLIVDDIQAGCGRTGTFFSFEPAGIKPDIVTLSKSISGYGLPFALTLFRPELDVWEPGEHNGTFRGNNHAFVTATAALEAYWADRTFENEIAEKSNIIKKRFDAIALKAGTGFKRKGRGIMTGVACPNGDIADACTAHALANGLIIETSGAHGEVVKCLAPLTIPVDDLESGLDIFEDSFNTVLAR